MNLAEKAEYRALMAPIVKPLRTYQRKQLSKKRSHIDIAKEFGVSTNSYRAWLKGKTVPDLNHMHKVVDVLKGGGITVGLPILSYLRDHPQVEQKKQPPKKKVAAKSKKKPRVLVKRNRGVAPIPAPIIDEAIRVLVREEVQKVLDGLSIRIQT